MDQKRLLLAALLSLVVLFGWQALFPPPEPVEEAPAQAEPVQAEQEITDSEPPVAESGETESNSEAPLAEVDSEPTDTASQRFEPRAADRLETVVLTAGNQRAEFSNRGGVLEHFILTDHLESGGGELDLVRRREGGLRNFALIDGSGKALPVNDSLFEVQRGSNEVGFVYASDDLRVEKHWRLLEDGKLEFSVSVEGVEGWGWHLGPGVRNPPAGEAVNRLMRHNAIYRSAGAVETIAARKVTEPVAVDAATASWFGLEDNYFLASAIASGGGGTVHFVPFRSTAEPGGIGTWVPPGPVFDNAADDQTEWGMWIYPQSQRWDGSVYLGAKEMRTLAGVAPGLDDTVHTGMLRILARPLHVALLWIHDNVVANYGWAIVLLTVLVRILLFPLTHKSAVSMRKMQTLNPKIQGIRAKYRPKLKDKQGRPDVAMQRKMNEEVMALYKSEGVNPAGGCLPMLLQLPVFIAFYSMLPVAVELRNAPWIGWIHDLSLPDPYYALPIVMGASQLLFQRLMPSTGDKMQQRIMTLMPIFFTFLFLKFAAGLVLYWLTSNLLGIGQQLMTNRLLGPPEKTPSASE